MKNLIDQIAAKAQADQLNYEILGVYAGRNLITTSTLQSIDMVEIRFLLKNLTTGEKTETPFFLAQKDEMIKFANRILEAATATRTTDGTDNRTIN